MSRLHNLIRTQGPIPFATFMEEALYGEGGYYSRQDIPIGEEGDYVTGPTLSPLFGRVTARLLGRLDKAIGKSAAEMFEAGYGTGVQILFVAEGRCRFQHWGGPVQEAEAGETVYIPAGEKHWHGATPEAPMVHVALNIDLETEWLEPVSDAQYRG